MMTSLTALVSLFAATAALAGASPDQIISRSDDVRNPAGSYLMTVNVKSSQGDSSVFRVSIQGNSKTLVKTLEPARDRGRKLLMLDEEMWAYLPSLKRAVRVSLSQKLIGQAANGDISRMRWGGDYSPKIESETSREWVLFLTAKKKGLTYDKIRVWIEKDSFRPEKAQFLTPAGKPLKTAVYGGYRMLAGKERPSQILIQDAIRPDDRSTIEITEMNVRDFPASIFNQNSLSQ